MIDFRSFMPHSAESVQMFVILFHFFTERSPWKAKNLIQQSQKLKLEKHQAQMDLPLTFVLIKNILCSEFRIATSKVAWDILCALGETLISITPKARKDPF